MSVDAWLDYVDKSFNLSPKETSIALSNLFILDTNQPILSSLQNDILDVSSTELQRLETNLNRMEEIFRP